MSIFPTSPAPPPADEHRLSVGLAAVLQQHQETARKFALLFGRANLHEDRTEAEAYQDAVRGADLFRVDYQVALPFFDSRTVRPDLSIAGWRGDTPAFQLLVEAKLNAPFHKETVNGVDLLQPAAYAAAWGTFEAAAGHVRRVGTLTRDPAPSDPAVLGSAPNWVAQPQQFCGDVGRSEANVTWMSVEICLDDLSLRDDGFVGRVARDLGMEIAAYAYPRGGRGGGLTRSEARGAVEWIDEKAHLERKAQQRGIMNVRLSGDEKFLGPKPDGLLEEFLESLPDRNARALRLALGMGGAVYTLEEVGYKLGESRHFVEKLLVQGLAQLTERLSVDSSPEGLEP